MVPAPGRPLAAGVLAVAFSSGAVAQSHRPGPELALVN
ncbi:hypothetical protein BKA01_006243 [Pseudonocardia eucalypti]|nr:hypothetical protein [Pseudonocardia eucalypti]